MRSLPSDGGTCAAHSAIQPAPVFLERLGESPPGGARPRQAAQGGREGPARIAVAERLPGESGGRGHGDAQGTPAPREPEIVPVRERAPGVRVALSGRLVVDDDVVVVDRRPTRGGKIGGEQTLLAAEKQSRLEAADGEHGLASHH
jgi:hypothetical protein